MLLRRTLTYKLAPSRESTIYVRKSVVPKRHCNVCYHGLICLRERYVIRWYPARHRDPPRLTRLKVFGDVRCDGERGIRLSCGYTLRCLARCNEHVQVGPWEAIKGIPMTVRSCGGIPPALPVESTTLKSRLDPGRKMRYFKAKNLYCTYQQVGSLSREDCPDRFQLTFLLGCHRLGTRSCSKVERQYCFPWHRRA